MTQHTTPDCPITTTDEEDTMTTTDYTITTTDGPVLTDGWDIALALDGKPGVLDIEQGRGFKEDPDAWITRADGIRLAVGTDVEDIEDEDGDPIGRRVIGVTWTQYETDPDGIRLPIGTDGEIIEDPADIAGIIDSLTDWAYQGAATASRVVDEVMHADELADVEDHEGIEVVESIDWETGILDDAWVDHGPQHSTGLTVTRADGFYSFRDVVIELEVDEHDQVTEWRVGLWKDAELIDSSGYTLYDWTDARGMTIRALVRDIVPAVRRMLAMACDPDY